MIHESHQSSLRKITWQDLYAARFAFNRPFQLILSSQQILYVEKIIRLVPRRRMIVFAVWRDQPVVAKLFFKPQHAKKKLAQDVKGINILLENKIPTPKLLCQDVSLDKQIFVLIFERIFHAKNIEEICRNHVPVISSTSSLSSVDEELLTLINLMVKELATQHVLGVLQNDLHLKNFLWDGKVIYTLDGGEITTCNELVSKELSLKNLAEFFAQFGALMNMELQLSLLDYYAGLRGWLLTNKDKIEFLRLIKRIEKKRWHDYSRKIFRHSSDFCSINTWHTAGAFDRNFIGPEFSDFLQNPENMFNDPHAVFLKKGNSATVVKTVLDGRTLVIKRYNIKNIFHGLRRIFRKTRARNSWKIAQKLNLFYILTAKPIAFLERRFFCFSGTSYFVNEYISDQHIGDFFNTHAQHPEQTMLMVQHIATLLKNLKHADMTHGDLKQTNILIDAQDRPVIIDFDGVYEPFTALGLHQMHLKEVQRFLTNFEHNPELIEQIKLALNL